MKWRAKVLVDFDDFTLCPVTTDYATDGVYSCMHVTDSVWDILTNGTFYKKNCRWVKVEVEE